MDFTTRGDAPAATSNRSAAGTPGSNKKRTSRLAGSKVLRYASLVLLFSVAALLIALAASFAFSKNNGQAKYVNEDQMQAVFLNGGQVYFGKISVINSRYITMNNIYYLRVNQQVQPNQNSEASNDVSLVKLGCELHGPQDQMVINSEQVVFWENLKSDGQVAKAVEQYVKENPNGQDCSKAAESTAAPAATTPAATTNKKP